MLIFKPFTRFFDFTGRASRKEYWLFVLFCLIVYAIMFGIDAVFGLTGEATGLLSGIFYYVTFIPHLAVMVRRLHDSNRMGAWAFLWGMPLLIMADTQISHPSLNDADAFTSFPFHWSEIQAILSFAAFLIGVVWFIVLMCWRGTAGKNRFGDPDR